MTGRGRKHLECDAIGNDLETEIGIVKHKLFNGFFIKIFVQEDDCVINDLYLAFSQVVSKTAG